MARAGVGFAGMWGYREALAGTLVLVWGGYDGRLQLP